MAIKLADLLKEAISKKKVPTPDALSDINKKISQYKNTLFGIAYFRIDSSARGTDRYDKDYDIKKNKITEFIKSTPYAVYILAKMDPKFYLGLTRNEQWWAGDSLESILKDMAFTISLSSQGEPAVYVVYKNGKPIKKGSGLPTNINK